MPHTCRLAAHSEVRIIAGMKGRILALSGLVVTLAVGCGLSPTDDVRPTPAAPSTPPSPVRRLTAEETNRTLRDLFPAHSLPTVELTEDRGKDFAQEVQRQPVSDLVIEQLRAGIIDVTASLAEDLDTLLPRRPTDEADEVVVVEELLEGLLPRAFRRPVPADDRQRFVDFFIARRADGDPFTVALQLTLQAVLQSPGFVYRLELDGRVDDADDRGRVPVSSVEMASRLSYFLWGSMPDDTLLQAGIDGRLATTEGLLAEVDRLLADPRHVEAMLSFHRQWLEFDRILTTNKSAQRFPQYNEFTRQAMRREADQFIAMIATEEPTVRALLTSRRTRLLPALGPVYGVDVDTDDQEVELPDDRSGILTQAQFLASHGHALEGSPVLRGVFVLERLVCEPPPIPDASIDITPPTDEGPEPRTNRERYAQHTNDPVCASCHIGIDGIGFGLEGYDSIGRFRTVDNGFPVDDSGSLDGTRIGGAFSGARELGRKLADSEVVHDCVARHWFRFANGRREQSGDRDDIAAAATALTAADTAIPALLRAIVLTDAFRLRRVR
jgi:hypothetical protein